MTAHDRGSTRAAFIGVALLALAAPTAAGADTFKIGLIADYTGAFASWVCSSRTPSRRSRRSTATRSKGPRARTSRFSSSTVYTNSAGRDKAKQLGEELVLRERVKMLAGFYFSPHAMAVGQIANEAKVPVMIMNAATASITRGSPYYVRTSDTIPQWAATMGQWAAANGVFRPPTFSLPTMRRATTPRPISRKVFKQNGGEIIGSARTPSRKPTSPPTWNGCCRAKPDVLYMFEPSGSPSIAFVKAYVEAGPKQAGIRLIGGGETAEMHLPNFTDDVIGVNSVNGLHRNQTRSLRNVEMRTQLRKMFGDKGVTDIASVGALGCHGSGYLPRAPAKSAPTGDGSTISTP